MNSPNPIDNDFIDAMTKLHVWRKTRGSNQKNLPLPAQELDENGKIKEFTENELEIINAYSLVVKKVSSLQEGDCDPWMRSEIKYLIHKSTRFIIYLDRDYEIQWWWITPPEDSQNISLLQANITQIESDSRFLVEPALKPKWFSYFRRKKPAETEDDATGLKLDKHRNAEATRELIGIRAMLGEAVSIALHGGTKDEWKPVLDEVKKLVLLEKDRRCRPWFILFFLLIVFILNFIPHLHSIPLFKNLFAELPIAGAHNQALISLGAGSIGAMVSAISRTQEIGLDPRSKLHGIFTEASARAILGATAGAITSLAIDSKFLLGSAVTVSNSLLFFLAFASGFSERILPALMSKAEKAITNDGAKS